MRFWIGTRVPAKHGAPLMISGSILTTDWLTFPNFGQTENYCKKQKSSFRRDAETSTRGACAPQILRLTQPPLQQEMVLETSRSLQ